MHSQHYAILHQILPEVDIPIDGVPRVTDLAAQLPNEIGRYPSKVDIVERFAWNEFIDRIVEKKDYNPEDERGNAIHHDTGVMDVVDDAVTVGTIADLHDQISAADDWNELFELVDQEENPRRRRAAS